MPNVGKVDGMGGNDDGIEIPDGNGKGSVDGNGKGNGGRPGAEAGVPASAGPASAARGLVEGGRGAAGTVVGCKGGAMTTGASLVGADTGGREPAGAVVTVLVDVGDVLGPEDCASSELVCAVARAMATTAMAKAMVPTKSQMDPLRPPRARPAGGIASLYRAGGVGTA